MVTKTVPMISSKLIMRLVISTQRDPVSQPEPGSVFSVRSLRVAWIGSGAYIGFATQIFMCARGCSVFQRAVQCS